VFEEKITLPAFAKINLGLRVKGRRADGYHEISTVFQTITLHDRLTFELKPDEGIEIVCSDPDIPTDEGNLVVRAAAARQTRQLRSSPSRIFGISKQTNKNLKKRERFWGLTYHSF